MLRGGGVVLRRGAIALLRRGTVALLRRGTVALLRRGGTVLGRGGGAVALLRRGGTVLGRRGGVALWRRSGAVLGRCGVALLRGRTLSRSASKPTRLGKGAWGSHGGKRRGPLRRWGAGRLGHGWPLRQQHGSALCGRGARWILIHEVLLEVQRMGKSLTKGNATIDTSSRLPSLFDEEEPHCHGRYENDRDGNTHDQDHRA